MEGTLKSWVVYRHISPSGKVYIGITFLRPKDRWGLGGNKYQKGTYSKAVAQYSLEGELIQIHNSISSAARLINGDASYIVKCCKGIKDSAYGYIWKYKI